MENENESTNKSADNDNILSEDLNKYADNSDIKTEDMRKQTEKGKEKYLFMKGKKKTSKIPIILGVIMFFTIAVAGAYYLYTNQSSEKSPQEIIKSSMEEMSNLKTYQVDGRMSYIISMEDNESKNQSAEINIIISGKNDNSDIDSPKAYYGIKAGTILENKWGSEEYSIDFEEIVFGQETAYFRINDYNLGMEAGTMLGPQIESYKEKWYFLNAEETQKFFEGFGAMSPVSAETMGAYDESKIMDIISKYEVLKFDKDLGDEKINGMDVYHYKVKLDGAAIARIYLDIIKEVVPGYSKDAISSEEFEEDLAKTIKDMEENYRDLINEGFQKAEIETWIGKEDGYIYRAVVKGEMDEKYIDKFLKATLESAKAKAMDAQIKSEIAQERIYLEIHYDDNNNSYENFVLSKNLDLKPENVRTNKDSYVLWSELNSTMDKWCVDSTGKSGYVLGEISGFECPESLSNISLGEKKDYANLESSSDIQDIKINLDFNMDLSYSNFNKPMEIKKPEDAEDLGGILESLMTGFSAMPIVQDSDEDGLSDDLEIFYKTDKNNPDTDGDGYKDGEEVEKGYDPALPGDAKLIW
jgi:hypothetical protein